MIRFCPYCKAATNFMVRWCAERPPNEQGLDTAEPPGPCAEADENGYYLPPQPTLGAVEDGDAEWKDSIWVGPEAGVNWVLAVCVACQGPILVFLKWQDGKPVEVRQFPSPEIGDVEGIPGTILRDYQEGLRCLHVRSYKACVTMCRRAVQGCARDKGIRKRNLQADIDGMKERELIPSTLWEVANQVRTFGNIGAHPDGDGLEDVTANDAKEISDFTYLLLQYLYALPRRVELLKQSRQTSGQSGRRE